MNLHDTTMQCGLHSIPHNHTLFLYHETAQLGGVLVKASRGAIDGGKFTGRWRMAVVGPLFAVAVAVDGVVAGEEALGEGGGDTERVDGAEVAVVQILVSWTVHAVPQKDLACSKPF